MNGTLNQKCLWKIQRLEYEAPSSTHHLIMLGLLVILQLCEFNFLSRKYLKVSWASVPRHNFTVIKLCIFSGFEIEMSEEDSKTGVWGTLIDAPSHHARSSLNFSCVLPSCLGTLAQLTFKYFPLKKWNSQTCKITRRPVFLPVQK